MMPGQMQSEADARRLMWHVMGVIGALCLVVYGAILIVNQGTFTFSFDDPYIHLAMAEEILRGHYGINPDEPAAAASSIIYPFLLAPLLALGFGAYAALVLNMIGVLAIGAVASAILLEAELPVARLPRLILAIVASVLASGIVSLAFSGLEHTLQVAGALLCLWGLMRYLKSRRVEIWWMAALIVAPLIRYEGMSLLAAGVVVLALHREWARALLIGFVGFGLVAAFSGFLLSLGLSLLPSSVLVKSMSAASSVEGGFGGIVQGFARTLGANVQDPRGWPLLVGTVLVLVPFIKAVRLSSDPAAWDKRAFIGLFCGLVGFAHLALGAYTWLARYEIYAILILLFGLVAIHAERLRPVIARADAWQVTWISFGILILLIRLVVMTPATVTGAQNIYQQQYQMHRFVTEVWQAPVAVNDLGWVSFENDHHVLDLFGLGSDKARKAHIANPQSGEWMDALAAQHDVRLAMIYPAWLGHIPCSWVRLGELRLGTRAVSVPMDHVTFYAIKRDDAAAIADKVRGFAMSLPEGVTFSFADFAHVPARNAYCAE